ncbi:DUF1707 domain-containing protein [Nocardioides sp.]|jgi:uncharacterized membrane protein|uniref:DUF1707 SHOCT-like domain-containing protein n=1 Tax=Nocardioides sp. TaxID=35761 RepID=UPI0031FE9A26|nr:hypothetical protein [Nocardioides sp.]
MSQHHVRIGDVERDRAAAALGEHFAQGRLTLDEHTERLDQIWSARTQGDLEPVFRDLPGQAARASSSRPGRSTWPGGFRSVRRGLPFPLFPVFAFLVVLTIVTHIPIILVGLLVFWVLTSRRQHRWSTRH